MLKLFEIKMRIKHNLTSGFTLIELIIVVSIMVVLTTAMVLNLNQQRAMRDLKIAQSQLVSSIRKVQSYTLSARALPNGQHPQYYLIKFDLASPNQYTIQGMYNISSSPQYLVDVETVKLPISVRIASSNPLRILRSNNPTIQSPSSCSLLAFALPFAKTFLTDNCIMSGIAGNPRQVGSSASTDDYKKIIDFVKNNDCVGNLPATCTVSVDSTITITLSSVDGSITKTVTVNGVTGAVSFN